MRWISPLISIAIFAISGASLRAENVPDPALIEKTIRQLSHDDFETRDKARQMLLNIGESALPILEKALRTADAETRATLEKLQFELRWWEHTVWLNKSAVDTLAGKTVWTLDDHAVTYSDGRRVFVANCDFIKCLSLKDGTDIWKADGFPIAEIKYGELTWLTDIYLAKNILLCVAQKSVRAFDAASGKPLWATMLNYGPLQSPRRSVVLADDSFLILNNQTSECFALNNGEKRWSINEYASDGIALPDGKVALVLNDKLSCLQLADGKASWSAESKAHYQDRHVWLADKFIITGSSYTNDRYWTACHDLSDGKQLWEIDGYPVAAHKLDENTIVVARKLERGHRGDLIAYDTKTWQQKWVHVFRKDALKLLLEPEGIVLCEFDPQSSDVNVRALKATNGEVLWTADVQGFNAGHSFYYHRADIQRLGTQVILLDQQMRGSFVEAFDVSSGKSGAKWRREPE